MRTMTLPVKLTDSEKLQRASRVAVLNRDSAVLDEQKKDQAKAMSLRIGKLNAEASDLCQQIRTGEEMREVEVHFVKDFDRKIEETIRVDTGEIVETRNLGPRELQAEMFEDASGDPEPEAADETEEEAEESEPEEESEASDDPADYTEEERLEQARAAVRKAREELDQGNDEDDAEW